MKNLRYKIIFNNDFSLKEKFEMMKLPTCYFAESVRDFDFNKRNLKQSVIQRFFPNPVALNYAIISLLNVGLEQKTDNYKKEIIAVNEYNQKAKVIKIFDNSGDSNVLLPENQYIKGGHNKGKLINISCFPNSVYQLILLHDLTFHNSFIYDIIEDSNPKTGKKIKKSLFEIINDVLLNPSFVTGLKF